MRVIDLTQMIEENMPVFPGTESPTFNEANTYKKDGFKETKISIYTHTGTHIDPPAHLFKNGKTLDEFPPDQYIGKALVIDCRYILDGHKITLDNLLNYGEKLNKADFLLFNLGRDKFWGSDKYYGDYPCIDDDVLNFIINGNYKGIGFDVMGLDPIYDEKLTRHNKLFSQKEIINIENLCNLHLCGEELFNFSCFPLKIKDSDGSPARAVAWFE